MSPLRRFNRQVHLIAGLVLGTYVSVIGVTGFLLVLIAPAQRLLTGPAPAIGLVVANLRRTYPHTHVVSILSPVKPETAILVTLQSDHRFTVACDLGTGVILSQVPPTPPKFRWVYDLHENLLAGRPGRVINGCGAASLLLLVFTGLVNWRRTFVIDFRRRWKRINFDLHSAVGFWSAAFLALWSITGLYFVWPAAITALVNRVSPVVSALPPAITVDPDTDPHPLDLDSMLAQAREFDPGTTWKGLVFPASRRSPFEMLMSRSATGWRDDEDTLYFNPYNGQYIGTWRYGVNRTVGDWFVWLQMPLHFGTHWGLVAKVGWAMIGLSLPILAITGGVMYWNRSLSKKWKA